MTERKFKMKSFQLICAILSVLTMAAAPTRAHAFGGSRSSGGGIPKPVPVPSVKPKSSPTPGPTATATPKPTVSPSSVPSQVPSPLPSPKPTASPTPSSGSWWKPVPGTPWQIQFSGTLDTNLDVKAFDLDLFDVDQKAIDSLRSRGIKVICYFSAGSSENWRDDYKALVSAGVIGAKMDGWDGENWLNVKKIDALMPIMEKRMDLAVSRKCDALDLDNVDGYANKNGVGLTYADSLKYNQALAAAAHKRGLAVGLKNDLDQIKELVDLFDFSVNEECFQYNECEMLVPFIKAGKPVFGIEYQSATSSFCSKANSMNLDFLKKQLDLGAKRESCR
jgi:hypothetical protein